MSAANSTTIDPTVLDVLGDLIRPMSARSIVASLLLGSHPPRVPGRHLITLASRFGVTEGTTRVALSRMVDAGELTNDDGTYELAGVLVDRQQRQEHQRRPLPVERWDGRWEQATVVTTGRSANDRQRLRQALIAAGFGELREGVWMRPANLLRSASAIVSPDFGDQLLLGIIELDGDTDTRALAGQLFDLDGWSRLAQHLLRAFAQCSPNDDLVTSFRLAAACLRHLVHDPVLPPALAPPDWPGAQLRARYDEYERALQAELRSLFGSLG